MEGVISKMVVVDLKQCGVPLLMLFPFLLTSF